MNFMNGKFFRVLEILTNFFLLNLIWLLACLPVVTIFPATAAMFAVSRQWILHHDESVFKAFFKHFKDNLKQSFIIGVLWSSFALVLYMNFVLLLEIESIKFVLFPFVILFSGLMLLTTVFLFPVMVHYDLRVLDIVKNSFFLAMGFLPRSLLGIGVMIGIFLLFIWQPMTIFISFSMGCYFIFQISKKVFEKKQIVTP
ncbi:YesL family protein [Metabacillus halosaccharovorans]|uniref:DUF624 domain-containing protein n=1 Tax=Metabacillus halosaccharovorans TaxID=930124 RepID=A0ABT3DPL8_9BACI|nr:DUF624 domain-containing protein [Metabacillus halosaccharovorans]MCV9888552.1 DUF624 domain-containing protein [Metabacillus halosaccharovorans]